MENVILRVKETLNMKKLANSTKNYVTLCQKVVILVSNEIEDFFLIEKSIGISQIESFLEIRSIQINYNDSYSTTLPFILVHKKMSNRLSNQASYKILKID